VTDLNRRVKTGDVPSAIRYRASATDKTEMRIAHRVVSDAPTALTGSPVGLLTDNRDRACVVT
jgi:hypothetical protein